MSRYGELYADAHERVATLVEAVGDERAATTIVPACPEWTIKEVSAHLAGVCSDVLAGNIEGAATDAWTAAQVEARQEHTASAVIAEWRSYAPGFAAMLDDFPGWYGAQLVTDVTTHEQDLRAALGEPPTMNDGIACAVEFLVSAVAHPAAAARGIGPLEIRSNGQAWRVGGTGGTTGDPIAAVAAAIGDGTPLPPVSETPVGVLEADPRELCRAFTGRRSAAQIRRFGWSGDPDVFLPLFAQPPFFTLRPDDLVD
jgi:uncharacterized protein (TIGR03083 family)